MQSDIDEKGYTVLRNFIDTEIIYLLKTYLHDVMYLRLKNDDDFRIKTASTGSGDVCPEGQLQIYGDMLLETMSLLYGEKLCNLTGKNLSPTYTYVRFYEKGHNLAPHIDRPSCQYSITIPVYISDFKSSSIYLSLNKQEPGNKEKVTETSLKNDGSYTRVDLFPGDGLAYKGMEHYHWRDPLESDLLIQFFMHFVETDGIYKDYIFDKRPFLGFKSKK